MEYIAKQTVLDECVSITRRDESFVEPILDAVIAEISEDLPYMINRVLSLSASDVTYSTEHKQPLYLSAVSDWQLDGSPIGINSSVLIKSIYDNNTNQVTPVTYENLIDGYEGYYTESNATGDVLTDAESGTVLYFSKNTKFPLTISFYGNIDSTSKGDYVNPALRDAVIYKTSYKVFERISMFEEANYFRTSYAIEFDRLRKKYNVDFDSNTIDTRLI